MRKKCVRWTKSAVLGTLTAALLWVAPNSSTTAQTIDPSTLPLITLDQLQYLGGFRLPATIANGDHFAYGGKMLTYNPGRNSLFVGSNTGNVAEITIPAPVNSADISALPFASYLQGFADLTEGHLTDIFPNMVSVDGLMVYGNRLYGSAYIYYDANNVQSFSHFSHSLNLQEPSFSGWSQVWESRKSGYVAGFMSPLPSEWHAALGAPAITGQCCIPIVSRTSLGPAAFGFDPAQIGQPVVSATPYVYYTMDHPTLGLWASSNPTYGATTQIGGMTVIPGTRTVLYVGGNGVGPHCYGGGTDDPARHLTYDEHGLLLCYDPTSTDKGSHAYPYNYQMWAYDLNDFAAVKAGTKQPWEVVPYGVWPLSFPISEMKARMGGITYDAQRKTLYVSQLRADRDGYSYRAIIHAYRIGAEGVISADTTSSVILGADKTAPQAPQTSITFLAIPKGVTSTYQYKWTVNDGAAATVTADWSTNNRYTWTPSGANAAYSVKVEVRNGSGPGAAVTSASMPFPIVDASPGSPTSSSVSSVLLSTDRPAPQPAETPIVFAAAASGGVAPQQYKWHVYDGANWTVAAEWSTASTFTWTPTAENPNGRVSVWARSAGNTNNYHEAAAETGYAIGAPVAKASGRVTAVTMTANKPAPQTAGATITWTAVPTGGAAPQQYKWHVYDGTNWVTATGWSTSSTFAWTPASAHPGTRVAVWARSAGSTNDYFEASTENGYALEPPVNHVVVTADKVAPQAPGTTVTWTAAATGGIGPLQYKWSVFDGANWAVAANWSTSNTFVWTPAVANAHHAVAVGVRSATNQNDSQEAAAQSAFAIESPQPKISRIAAVTLTAGRTPPQLTGTSIAFSALPSGGSAPYQYKWFLYDGTNWNIASEWSGSSSFVWTPTAPNARYRVAVWARSAGNTNDYHEASTETGFAIEPPVQSVALSANKVAPQVAGTTIAFTAVPAGGIAPHQYQWYVYDGVNWNLAANWSSSSTFTWTPAAANNRYRVAVWVRSAGNTNNYHEASTETGYPIDAPLVIAPADIPVANAPAARVTAVSLSANRAAPQPAGTPIAFTAVPAGGVAPHQYQWYVYDGVDWNIAATWSSANTFTWTPGVANTRYRISVWVRSAGNTNNYHEAAAETGYAIDPPVASGRVTAVVMTANQAAPQAPGTTITWVASATGGTSPQYKWFVYDGANWTMAANWSGANTFHWTPTAANANYRIAVWARTGTSTNDYFEASTETGFAVR
jgi:hypothetical protein